MIADECIFCQIAAGDMPAHVVFEDDKHLAFLTIFPNTEGATVVITKEHLPSYAFANDDKVLTDLVLAAKTVAHKIDAAYDDVGRTGMIFEGFGVDHLHCKLYPMHGTGEMIEWKPLESGNERTEFYTTYPGFLSSHDAARADDETLKQVAKKIKVFDLK